MMTASRRATLAQPAAAPPRPRATDRHGAGHGAGDGARHGAPQGALRCEFRGESGPARAAMRPAAPCFPGKAREHGAAAYAPAPHGVSHGAQHGAPHGASRGATHGASRGASRGIGNGEPVDAQLVIYRLEEAGRTLLALPPTGYTTKLRTSSIDLLRATLDGETGGPRDPSPPGAGPRDAGLRDAGPRDDRPLRPAVPSASRITRMDEAFAWVVLIPRDRYMIRRIVGCRALVSPITERHLFSWRRIGTLLGADHKAIQRWHAQGIDMIVAAVNATR